jgi:hypothetical protein
VFDTLGYTQQKDRVPICLLAEHAMELESQQTVAQNIDMSKFGHRDG